jgi:uncharacterized membrane protein
MAEARLTFLAALRAGLRGASPDAIEDAIADYASHFDLGAANGRDDADIAAALGDPLALADELCLEMSVERFNDAPSLASAARLIGAAVSLGAVNAALAFLGLPLFCVLQFAAALAFVTIIAVGAWFLFAGAGLGFGWLVSLLAGAGLILAAIALGAAAALAAMQFVRAVGRHAQSHYRRLRIIGGREAAAP